MELVVGVNSYMSLDEVEDLIKTEACINNVVLDTWNNLNEELKNRVIVKNTQKLDKNSFGYRGRKVNLEQMMQYPRIDKGRLVECPNLLKRAIVAMMALDLEYSNSEEIAMIRKGIESYKIKEASVGYRDVDVEKLIGSRKNEIYEEYLNDISQICF